MLSVYESAPDRFNFSQSWGWKSSTMILDDGMLGYEAAGEPKKPGNLRFMVVIGMSPLIFCRFPRYAKLIANYAGNV